MLKRVHKKITRWREAALACAKWGCRVFPLHSVRNDCCTCGRAECSSPGKHPRTPNGFKNATIDEAQIKAWWRQSPDANVGIATGASSGVIVLDVDPRNGGSESLAKLVAKHGPLPDTVVASTGGGGQHYYFAHPGGEVKCQAGALGPGLDLKADGGYVVAPPSRHVSGGRYEWQAGPENTELAHMPLWFRPKRTKKAARRKAEDRVLREGERNDRLASIAGGLRNRGLDEPTILAALMSINATSGQPPLPEEEVARIAASISQYEPGTYKEKTAKRLIDLVGADVELFHSADGHALIRFPVQEHFENWPLRSETCLEWLRRRYWQKFQNPINDAQLNEAVQTLSGMARYEGVEYPVAVRLAKCEDGILLDLADGEWRAVKITRDCWRVVTDPGVRFRRTPGMLPLPVPSKDGDIGLLRNLINVPDDAAWALVLAWLVAAMNPDGPHPLLVITGEQGSAKSSLCRVLQQIVDPHEAGLRSFPWSVQDLAIACENSSIVAFDNVSRISDAMSDALCRVSTAASHATRELYTNDRERILQLEGAALLNGIGDVIHRPDLLSRSIMLQLRPIRENARKTESELSKQLKVAHARILGGLLDAIVVALRRCDKMAADVKSLPRMADFFMWTLAAEMGLGLPEGAIQEAYAANEKEKRAMVLDNAAMTAPLMRLLARRLSWSGTCQELLGELSENVRGHGGCSTWQERERPDWPKTPRKVRSQLDRLAPSLREEGIVITFLKGKHGSESRRLLAIEKKDAERPTGSPASPARLTKKARRAKKLTKKKRKTGGTAGTVGRNRTPLGQGDGEGLYEL